MAIASAGYDGTLYEASAAKLLPSSGAAQYGVVGPTDWKLTPHPTTAQAVNLSAGSGWGPSVFDTSDSVVTVQCDPITSGTRWDMITVKRDWQPVTGLTTFSKITGTATKQLPARLNNPGVVDEQPIWLVQWTAGQTQPTAIVDLRCWAGNGGVQAKDELALGYLARIGAKVEIGTKTWSYEIGSNDIAAWVKVNEIGTVPLFAFSSARVGGVPPAGTSFLVQSGTNVSWADLAGYGAVDFPKPFPNGVLYVKADSGDASIDAARGSALTFPIAGAPDWPNAVTLSRFVYAVQRSNGTRIPSSLHRADWIAVGW